jgi:hypothetical protein
VANLLDFDDDDNLAAAPAVATGLGTNKALPNVGLDGMSGFLIHRGCVLMVCR